MKKYLLIVAGATGLILAGHFGAILAIHSPLPAEYWIREFIVVKQHEAAMMPTPKIVFVGGSCTLFGIDAAKVQSSLHLPAINFGLNAGLRLEDHLAQARAVVKPGDTIVLSLEPCYYDEYTERWNSGQVRNALSWNRDALDRLPFARKAWILLTASNPEISRDLIESEANLIFSPGRLGRRLEALAPENDIVARFERERGSSTAFAYEIGNLDDNGDMLHTADDGNLFHGPNWPVTRPASVSPYARNLLVPFIKEMKGRNVRVLFDYTPYLIYADPNYDWKKADLAFRADIASLGGGNIIEPRDAFFYPNTLFFHSNLHLNEQGRELRTDRLIEALRRELAVPN
jgi:hypothetical protein